MGVTIWYRCLFCTRVFPKAPELIQHRNFNHADQWRERRQAKKMEKAKIAEKLKECESNDAVIQIKEVGESNIAAGSCQSKIDGKDLMTQMNINDDIPGYDKLCDNSNLSGRKFLSPGLKPEEVKNIKTGRSKRKRSAKKENETEERPYKCQRCDKSFNHKGNLQSHVIIHRRKKPHQCDVCQKSFAQKGNLRTHKMIHTGEKPFVCFVCNKNFRTKAFLTAHELIHSDIRPFSCPTCPLSFRTKGILKTHCVTQHNQK